MTTKLKDLESNVIMAAKDRFIELIDTATTVDQLEKLLFAIETTAGLWQGCGYAYKAKELIERIEVLVIAALDKCPKQARVQRSHIEEILASCRRNAHHFHNLQSEWFAADPY